MVINPDDEITKNVKIICERLLKQLTKEGHKVFEKFPTVEISHKGRYIFTVLIDEGNDTLKVEWNETLRLGKHYAYLPKEELIEGTNNDGLSTNIYYNIYDEISMENSYSANLLRVNNLIHANLYSLAAVFLVSALENATRDLFFSDRSRWFLLNENQKNKIEDEVFKICGVVIPNPTPELKGLLGDVREVEGVCYGVYLGKMQVLNKWRDIKYKEHIFKICHELRIVNEYSRKLLANKGSEVAHFELLEELLFNSRHLNFQAIKSKDKGIRWIFKKFLNLKFTSVKNELENLQDCINKRHRIIHGTLDDKAITLVMIEEYKRSLKSFIEYLKRELHDIRPDGYFFERSLFL